MAMGRASGENRVQKAIMNALDSPLIYGNDIGKAKRILFNIYASDEHPIFVNEMLQIDDFFDQLDPNIDVIWGTATDDTLGEDAKVTILATGLEDDLRRGTDGEEHDDSYYEALIAKLYKPMKPVTVTEVVTKDQPTFEVEAAKEPERMDDSSMDNLTMDNVQFDSPRESREPSALGRLGQWLNAMMKTVTE